MKSLLFISFILYIYHYSILVYYTFYYTLLYIIVLYTIYTIYTSYIEQLSPGPGGGVVLVFVRFLHISIGQSESHVSRGANQRYRTWWSVAAATLISWYDD